jgi:selenocysteine-specific elongation factor
MRFFVKGGQVRTGGGEMALSAADRRALAALEEMIERGGFEFPSRADLRKVAADEKHLDSFLHILEESGAVVRISQDTYIHRKHWDTLVEGIRARLAGGGALSVGDFKELFGFSRKYAVPLLESLDREGFTRREGDARVAGPKLAQ